MSQLSVIALIFTGGGLGSLARFAIGKLSLSLYANGKFPIGTLIANALACTILGFALFYIKDKPHLSEWLKYFVVIGFCGGFSTFSTFSFDTVKLFHDGLFITAVLNILISLALGVTILWVLLKA